MSVILDAIGWPLGVLLALVAVSVAYRMVRDRSRGQHRDRGSWITVLMFACAALADFTALGLLTVEIGAILAGLAFAAFLVLAQPWRKGVARSLRSNAATGIGWLGHDARTALGRVRGTGWLTGIAGGVWRRIRGGGHRDVWGVPVPLEEALARRPVPSIREDPDLGEAPAPEAIAAAGTAIPAPYAALASWIASLDPENEAAEHEFIRGHAAGKLAVSEAMMAHADHLLNGVGLDPAAVAAVVELGEVEGQSAADAALVDRRLLAVYREIHEWRDRTGRELPFRAREWFGDGNAA